MWTSDTATQATVLKQSPARHLQQWMKKAQQRFQCRFWNMRPAKVNQQRPSNREVQLYQVNVLRPVSRDGILSRVHVDGELMTGFTETDTTHHPTDSSAQATTTLAFDPEVVLAMHYQLNEKNFALLQEGTEVMQV